MFEMSSLPPWWTGTMWPFVHVCLYLLSGRAGIWSQVRWHTAHLRLDLSTSTHCARVCRPPFAFSFAALLFALTLRQSMQRFQLLNLLLPHVVQIAILTLWSTPRRPLSYTLHYPRRL